MTADLPFVFPSSRVLAGWWKHLAPRQPRALWVGHLLLHRVEVLAELQETVPLDRLSHLILRSLALSPRAPVGDIARKLGLDWPILRQLVRQLEGEGLVQTDMEGVWSLTPLGHHALANNAYARAVRARRGFHFVESEEMDGPPHFLNLADTAAALPWDGTDGGNLALTSLRECVEQTDGWRRQYGFPLNVRGILGCSEDGSRAAESDPWRRVVFDRRLQLPAVLLATADSSGERLLGYAFQPDGWVLFDKEPAFTMAGPHDGPFAQLAIPLALDVWRQAWCQWCEQRGLGGADVETSLQQTGCQIRVEAPQRLVTRWRSEALRNDTWLLAGTGRLRRAARLVVVP